MIAMSVCPAENSCLERQFLPRNGRKRPAFAMKGLWNPGAGLVSLYYPGKTVEESRIQIWPTKRRAPRFFGTTGSHETSKLQTA
jgi:hypothetical protein